MDINNTIVITDPIAGSGLAASQDIGIGDVIIQLSSPYLLIVEKEALENVCSFCLIEASSVDIPLKRCSACRVPRYCSSGCQKKDWTVVHQKECPILKKLPDIPPTPVRALMQLLLRHQHGTSLDPRWAGLESHVADMKKDRKRWDEIVLQAQAAVGFSKSPQDRIEVTIQVLCRMITNAFRATLADDSPVGLCFEPILALANHSCSPNAVVVFDGRSVALRALDSIKKGEQVFISYITAMEDRTSRQRDLKQRYFFDCQCEKCREDETSI
ncbi:SET domain-containing protein [Hyaloscypha variabilis F]|uniref:SET domain-containing protein n=1 Tax=Hyaloscypha variabilis (strain UAMH 11265 / GT02V1 / F) TaxID=1149755 RepID=A0A2J6RTG2_HYAVF|nr:SET domain-containing protein [Hyaloscypha variabilis F]